MSMKAVPKQRGCGGCLTLFVVFGVLVCFIVTSLITKDMKDHPEDYNNSATQDENKTITEKSLDITPKQNEEIEGVLKQCGIENIIEIKHDAVLDDAHKAGDTGYRITCEKAADIKLCLTPSKKVCRIVYSGKQLYKKEKVIATLDDFILSSEELAKYQTICINVVTEVLRSPSTAKFAKYSDWGFSKGKKKIIIQSYVDSQNAFGAVIRSKFQITIKRKDDSISSFIFDGEELLK